MNTTSNKPKFLQRAVYFIGILFITSVNASGADTLITPDDSAINYYGRFDFTNPKAPRFNWSGTTIEFVVSGTSIVGIELTSGGDYFDIEVDGKVQSTPLNASVWTSKRYDIATGLSNTEHIVRIVQRNEPYWVITTFSGIYLSNGGKLKALAKPVRKMEFCGDSFTAGYFIEACDDQQAKTNTNKSWARLTSKAFKAQDIILAESGIGLSKSLGGKTCFPIKYQGTLDTVGTTPTPAWKFSSWIPDIVTIFLGINDNSSGVTDNEYTTALHSFVTTIRGNYPTTPILFMAATGCKDQATKAAVVAETTSLGHKNIHFFECKQTVHGCSWHPTVTDAKEISDSVVVKIKQITGWDTNTVSVNNAVATDKGRKTTLKATFIDSKTVAISSEIQAAGTPIEVVNAHGAVVERLKFNSLGQCRWTASHVSKGLYYIGSHNAGWTRAIIR